MGYVLLAGAIAAEVAATTAMKYSAGFGRLTPSFVTVLGYVLSFFLFARALITLEVGTAYAIWAGTGTAAIASIGMAFLGEPVGAAKLGGIVLVIAGAVLLNTGGAH